MAQFPSRRDIVRRLAVSSAVVPALALAGSALAAGSTPKADVKYQFTPNGTARCADCVSFIPGDSSGGPGTCKAVAGPIPQNGWCILFAKRR
jgi:hypothetical protein